MGSSLSLIKILIFYSLYIVSFNITAQTIPDEMARDELKSSKSFWDNVSLSLNFGIAQHDMRFSERKPVCEGCQSLERQPDKWGTWQYGLSISKPFLHWKFLTLETGLGYSLEHLTYFRPVDHCFHFNSDICSAIRVYSDNYKIHIAQLPVNFSFHLVKGLELELSLLPQFDFYKKLIGRSGNTIAEKMTINLYSIEANPGISYNWNRVVARFSYRIYQIKKVDRVIYSPRLFNSRQRESVSLLSKNFEDYNPLKFWFSVGYRLGNVNQDF